MIVAVLLSGTAMFMFYPLVVVELRAQGYSLAAAGIVFGLLAGTGQVLAIAIARVVAEVGGKRCAFVGLVARSLGLVAMGLAPSLIAWVSGAVMASLGGSAVVLSLKAELLRSAVARDAVVKRTLAVNVGALVGPGVGGLLYSRSSFWVVVLASVCLYSAVALLLLLIAFEHPENSKRRRPGTPDGAGATVEPARSGVVRVEYARLLIVVGAYWFVYAQLGTVVPVLALEAFGSKAAAGWMYMINAFVVLTCQYWLVARRLRSLGATRLLGFGFAAMCCASLCLFGPLSAALLVCYVVAFSFGELLISPALDEHTAVLRGPAGGVTTAFGTTASIAGIATIVAPSMYGVALSNAPRAVGPAAIGVSLALLGVLVARRERPRGVLEA